MKRKLLFSLFLAAALACNTFAQITVTRDAMPKIGYQIVTAVDETSTFDIGNAGPNQTWDFSNAVANHYDTAVYILPQQAPNYQMYPSANMAGYSKSADGIAYGFYNDSNSDLGIVGTDAYVTFMPGYSYVMHRMYMQPEWMYLPYNYGDNDTYNYTLVSSSGMYTNGVLIDTSKVISHVNGSVVVDAWGNMITPTGTFPVLRVKKSQQFIDSVFSWSNNAWTFDYVYTGSNLSYNWVNDQFGFVGQIYMSDKANGITFFVSQTLVNTNSLPISAKPTYISPNPVSDFINIQIADAIDKVMIYDMSGQLQMSCTNQKRINISHLNKGMYIVKMQTPKRTITDKFIKK